MTIRVKKTESPFQMAESFLPSIERIIENKLKENLEFNGPWKMFNEMAIVFSSLFITISGRERNFIL